MNRGGALILFLTTFATLGCSDWVSTLKRSVGLTDCSSDSSQCGADRVNSESINRAMRSVRCPVGNSSDRDRCLEKVGVEFRDATFCDEVSPEHVESCIEAIAKSTEDANLCSKLVGAAQRSSCYSTIARNDPFLCLEVKDAKERDVCLLTKVPVAPDSGSKVAPELCKALSSEQHRLNCQWSAALAFSDPRFCDGIPSERDKRLCLDYADPKGKPADICERRSFRTTCLKKQGYFQPGRCLSLNASDASACIYEARLGPATPEDCEALAMAERDRCLTAFGVMNHNPAFCDKVSEYGKSACGFTLATHLEYIPGCLTTAQSSQANCVRKLIKEVDDPKYCQLLVNDSEKTNCLTNLKRR